VECGPAGLSDEEALRSRTNHSATRHAMRCDLIQVPENIVVAEMRNTRGVLFPLPTPATR